MIRCGVRASSSATRSSASSRGSLASSDCPTDRAGSVIAAGSVQRASAPSRRSSASAESHAQLLDDRRTLQAVESALRDLEPITASEPGTGPEPVAVPGVGGTFIGPLAGELGIRPATPRKWEGAGLVSPRRDPLTGYRVYDEADVRDARLAHRLRRGGYPLEQIAPLIAQVRAAGGWSRWRRTFACADENPRLPVSASEELRSQRSRRVGGVRAATLRHLPRCGSAASPGPRRPAAGRTAGPSAGTGRSGRRRRPAGAVAGTACDARSGSPPP